MDPHARSWAPVPPAAPPGPSHLAHSARLRQRSTPSGLPKRPALAARLAEMKKAQSPPSLAPLATGARPASHFQVSFPLRPQDKPMHIPAEAFKKMVYEEYLCKYLEGLGVTPSRQTLDIARQQLPLDTLHVTAAWSRDCITAQHPDTRTGSTYASKDGTHRPMPGQAGHQGASAPSSVHASADSVVSDVLARQEAVFDALRAERDRRARRVDQEAEIKAFWSTAVQAQRQQQMDTSGNADSTDTSEAKEEVEQRCSRPRTGMSLNPAPHAPLLQVFSLHHLLHAHAPARTAAAARRRHHVSSIVDAGKGGPITQRRIEEKQQQQQQQQLHILYWKREEQKRTHPPVADHRNDVFASRLSMSTDTDTVHEEEDDAPSSDVARLFRMVAARTDGPAAHPSAAVSVTTPCLSPTSPSFSALSQLFDNPPCVRVEDVHPMLRCFFVLLPAYRMGIEQEHDAWASDDDASSYALFSSLYPRAQYAHMLAQATRRIASTAVAELIGLLVHFMYHTVFCTQLAEIRRTRMAEADAEQAQGRVPRMNLPAELQPAEIATLSLRIQRMFLEFDHTHLRHLPHRSSFFLPLTLDALDSVLLSMLHRAFPLWFTGPEGRGTDQRVLHRLAELLDAQSSDAQESALSATPMHGPSAAAAAASSEPTSFHSAISRPRGASSSPISGGSLFCHTSQLVRAAFPQLASPGARIVRKGDTLARWTAAMKEAQRVKDGGGTRSMRQPLASGSVSARSSAAPSPPPLPAVSAATARSR